MKQGLTEVLENRAFPIPLCRAAPMILTVPSLKNSLSGQRHGGGGALDFASTAEAAEIVGGSSVYGKYISGYIRRRDDAVPTGSA